MRLPYFTELGWTVIAVFTAFMGMVMLWVLE